MIALHAAPFSEENRKKIRSAVKGENVLFCSRREEKEKYCHFLKEAEVVVGNISVEDVLEAGHLQFLQATSAGVDQYTENPAFPRDIALANVSGAFGGIIAEHILGGILTLYRRFPAYYEQQKQGLWKDAGSENSLEGKTAVVLGTGDIGRETARRLKAFGVKTIGIRRRSCCPVDYFDEVHKSDELDEVLPLADILVGCLPRTPETTGLLDKRRLSVVKKGALFVNVGRGSLVVTDALVEALRSEKLFGAVLDVTDPEPLPPDHPLWKMKNVLITPHISGIGFGHTGRVEEKIADICCGNLKAYLEGRPLRNLVNLKNN